MSAALPNMPKVSTSSGKLEGIHAINTNTVTNEFCKQQKETDTICGTVIRIICRHFPQNCQPSFQHNSEVSSPSCIGMNCLA